ncbi:O-antigen ligase family protein [Agreia sp. Leaf244]|uniref:O-antigen ligase family protein n=1 Tax=Agreia sp. Leaf244 TaxID=1736305 RepID=UPI00138F85E2|nr:O-antigen ligase family protein [Agreia sp. Leaf244]
MTLLLLAATPVAIVCGLLLPRWLFFGVMGIFGMLLPRANVLQIPLHSGLGGLVAWMRARRPDHKVRGLAPLVITLLFGAATIVLSFASSPDFPASLQAACSWAALASTSVLAVNLIMKDGLGAVGKVLALLTPIALAQALTTLVFRFIPTIESAYYSSSISKIFLGGAGQALSTDTGRNNVVSLVRAGGFLFVNVNRASMVMGIILLAYCAYALLSSKKWPLLVVIPLAAAIALGGSKTGIALLVVLPLFSIFLATASRAANAPARMGLVLSALAAAVVGVQVFFATADDFLAASEETLQPRLQLWGEAIRAIRENWFLGLGYGGWTQRWEQGNVHIPFSIRPVHDWFLQAWLDGGILFAAANVIFVFVIVTITLRAVSSPGSFQYKLAMAFAGAAFLWAIIHGLGDNTSILSDPPALVFLALLAGFMLAGPHLTRPATPDEATTASALTSDKIYAGGTYVRGFYVKGLYTKGR